MKKTICLLLVLVLCLSLWACKKNSPDQSTTDSTDETVSSSIEDPQKLERYEHALRLLNKEIHQKQGSEFKEAYEILTELGDYKDAKVYLSRFTIIPDVLLSCVANETNAFNETKTTNTVYYLYDSKGRVIGEPTCDELTGQVDFWQYQINTYDNTSRLIEQKLMAYGLGEFCVLYSYNDSGLLIETKYINIKDGTTFLLRTTEYNDAGQMVKWESMTNDYQKNVREFEYENGLLVKKHHWMGYANEYPMGGDIQETFYEYTNGLLAKVCSRYNDSYETICEYENGLLMRVVYGNENVISNIYENGRIIRQQDEASFREYIYGNYYCYTPAE